jgi:hypothetical protein
MTELLKQSSASDSTDWGPLSSRRVLEFPRTLAAPTIPGVSGEVTARFAGAIYEIQGGGKGADANSRMHGIQAP